MFALIDFHYDLLNAFFHGLHYSFYNTKVPSVGGGDIFWITQL